MLDEIEAKLKDYTNPVSKEEYLEYLKKEREVRCLLRLLHDYDFCKQNSLEEIIKHFSNLIHEVGLHASLSSVDTDKAIEESTKKWIEFKQYTDEDWQNYFIEEVSKERKKIDELYMDGELDSEYEDAKSSFYFDSYLEEQSLMKSRISGREVSPSKEEEEIFERANAIMKR